jgi:hypothetical protein
MNLTRPVIHDDRNIIENMFVKLEKYSASLEVMVNERTLLLEEERRKTETLMDKILPRFVV